MNLTLTINGSDKTAIVDWPSFSIDDAINDAPNFCNFTIKKYSGQTFKPAIRDAVIVMDGSNKIFAGTILSIKETTEGVVLSYEINCKDYTAELDRLTITEQYVNMTANAIIADINTNYLAGVGITLTNVNCSLLINSITFNSIPVSKAIQLLAERLNYSWYIDYSKDLHFFAKNSEVSPFNLGDNTGNFLWNSLEVNQDISQLRNVIIVEGGEIKGSNTRDKFWTGDGSQKNFSTDIKFYELPTVTVGGVTKTVGLENIDKDAGFDCLWDFNQKTIRFVTAPAAAAAIIFTGYPSVPITVYYEDAGSMAIYGRYEFKKTEPKISSTEEALQYAQAQIEAYGASVKEGTFKSYVSGLKSGQAITITLTDRAINESFLIQRVTLEMRSPTEGQWTVELATLRTIGIISLLQKMLLDSTKNTDLTNNETLKKYYADTQTITVTEEISLKTKEEDYQTITVTEDIQKDPFGAGVKPDFVVCPYVVTGQTDKNREFLLDQSYLS